MTCKYMDYCYNLWKVGQGFRTANCTLGNEDDLGAKCEAYFNFEVDRVLDEVDLVYESSERLREVAERFVDG